MDVVGHHSDDVLCWVNLRPFGILHVPLLIFPRVVLGGGCVVFLERDATSILQLITPHELFGFGVMGMHVGESSSGALPLPLFFFYCNGQRYEHTLS